MAEKRMFSKKVISSDAFIDMPALSQALYFHLALMADDDGFVDNTRSVMRSIGASKEDIENLINKNFLIFFEDEGVSVISHWKINNNIRGDTYKETEYKNLKSQLTVIGGIYSLQIRNEPLQIRNADQISIDQVNLDQEREKDKNKQKNKETDKDPPLPPGKTFTGIHSEAGQDAVSRVEHHRNHWESCGLPPAPVIINMDELSRIKPVTDSFPSEKIDEAIKNFSAVVLQPNFNPEMLPGGHIPNFKNFLIRWVDRFTNEAKPIEVYKQKTKAMPPPGKGPDWGGTVDMGKPVKAKSFFEGETNND
jgi:hypothetical protein